jgi:GAF domain
MRVAGVDKDRADRIWELVTGHAVEGILSIGSVCAACVPALGMDGAALWLARDVSRRLLMHATNQVSSVLYEAAFTLGEGPCVQAWTERVMVLAPDLASNDVAARWPMFVPAAVSAGAGAVFAFPLQVGAIRVGVLDLYRKRAGPLSQAELADALALASAALTLVLRQVRVEADEMADDPVTMGETQSSEGLSTGQVEVYQATGMIVGQLNAGLEEALLRLRAYAFAHEMSISQTARLVVGRRLRFGGEDDD